MKLELFSKHAYVDRYSHLVKKNIGESLVNIKQLDFVSLNV